MRTHNVVLLGRLGQDHRGVLLFEWMARNARRFALSYRDRTFPVAADRSVCGRIRNRLRAVLDRWVQRLEIRAADLVVVLPMAREHEVALVRYARRHAKPVIADFYLSTYDTHVNDRRKVAGNDPRSRALRRSDLTLLTEATVTLFLNRAERDHYRAVVAGDEAVTWSDDRVVPLVAPERQAALLPYLSGEAQVCTICWWGTFIPLHGLETVIEAGDLLAQRKLPVRIALFGHSPEKAAPYAEMIARAGLTDTVELRTDLTFANGGLEPFLRGSCDIALGAFGTSAKARTVLTNKVVEACSMGIPTVTQPAAAIPEFFDDRRDILLSEPTAEGIAATIQWALENREAVRRIGAAALETYRRTFAPSRFLERIEAIVGEVIGEGARTEAGR